MSILKNGGPAFPGAGDQEVHRIAAAAIQGMTATEERDRMYLAVREQLAMGMSLRDYFAGEAIQGMLASGMTLDIDGNMLAEKRAGVAYAIADAMIVERAK